MNTGEINELNFNKETNLHSITEGGFKYEFPEALHGDFRNYVFQYHFVSRWYKQLNDKDRSKVIRQSAY